jgi:integrase/recombinase XerD
MLSTKMITPKTQGRGKSYIYAIDNNRDPVVMYLKSLGSINSQSTILKALFSFSKWYLGKPKISPQEIKWSTVEYSDIVDYQRHLSIGRKLQPATVNLYINAVKGVLNKAMKISKVEPVNKVTRETYDEIGEIKNAKGKRLTKARAVSAEDQHSLFNIIDNSTVGVRDKTILYLFLKCGLRLNELCDLQYPRDVDVINKVLTPIGKGDKEREIPLGTEAFSCLIKWIREVRGEYQGYFVCRVWRSGELKENAPLSHSGVRYILQKCIKIALVQTFSPHDLRRTFGTDLLRKGVDIFLVQELLGHSNPATTKRYDMRNMVDKRKAIETI